MLRFPELEQFGIIAAISGVADGDCSRNALPAEGKAGFLQSLGLNPEKLRLPSQVHGNHVVLVENSTRTIGEADALATASPGVPIGVTVADCVPVWLFSPQQHCGAIIHAGRESTRLNISGHAVRVLVREYGAVPSALHAVIGPSAGPCCYEVSDEMAEEFAALGCPTRGRRLDLWGMNQAQLEAEGLQPARIHQSRLCTICGLGFHSHRGTGTPARNLALLCL